MCVCVFRETSNLTFKNRCDLEHPQPSDGQHLPHGKFHEEHGDASEDEGEEVRDKEGATAILVAEVGEPPDIAQANS